MKYSKGEIDYHNSDATWHTLLTVTAYNETPIAMKNNPRLINFPPRGSEKWKLEYNARMSAEEAVKNSVSMGNKIPLIRV